MRCGTCDLFFVADGSFFGNLRDEDEDFDDEFDDDFDDIFGSDDDENDIEGACYTVANCKSVLIIGENNFLYHLQAVFSVFN